MGTGKVTDEIILEIFTSLQPPMTLFFGEQLSQNGEPTVCSTIYLYDSVPYNAICISINVNSKAPEEAKNLP